MITTLSVLGVLAICAGGALIIKALLDADDDDPPDGFA
jgi:hypothetical protein